MVNHPNLLHMKDHYTVHEHGKEYLNVVMEYFPYNLSQIIKKKELPVPLVKVYMFQLLKGLNYLASFSIAHRDIKPQNILIDLAEHKAVICDFGSAKQLVSG